MDQLYQDSPYSKCTYTQNRNRSFTDCLESYQYGAHKESMILKRNGRLPTKELVLNFLVVQTAKDIIKVLKVLFRDLKVHGLEGIANVEFTTGDDRKPNNTIHSHILTDDDRTIPELKELLITACERHGLVKDIDFWISNHRELPDPNGYIDYFTKYGYSQKVILFKPKTGIRKFHTIGKWYSKGRGKGVIWNEIKANMRLKYPDIETKDETVLDDIEVPFTSHDEPVTTQDIENKGSNGLIVKCRTTALECNPSPISVRKHLTTDFYLDVPEPTQRILDRRGEWKRYRHSVAVLR